MQDNRQHIDKEFTDFAWSQMNEVPDREMPVKKERKRRILPFFWLLLSGVVIGLVLALGLHELSHYRQQVASENGEEGLESVTKLATINPKSNENIASLDVKNEPIQEEKKRQEDFENESTSNSNNAPISTVNEDKKNQYDGSIEKNLKLKSKTKKAEYTTTVQMPKATVVVPRNPTNSDPITKSVNSKTTFKIVALSDVNTAKTSGDDLVGKSISKELSKNTIKAEIPRIIQTMNKLPIKTSYLPIDYEIRPDNLYLSIDPIDEIQRPDWGFKFGLAHALFDKQGSFYVGTFMDWRLSPKWYLQTGFNARYHRFNICETNNDALFAGTFGTTMEADDNSSTSFPSGGAPSSSESTTTSSSVCQHQHMLIELPLTLNYELTKKWHLSAGAYTAFNLSDSKNESNTDLTNQNNFDTYTNTYQTFDVGLLGGLRYYPSKRWALDLSYQYGLRPTFQLENPYSSGPSRAGQEYYRGLQLSAMFKF